MSTYLHVYQDEAINSFLSLFVYAEQQWSEWRELEDKIAEVDYDRFSSEDADLFIEFLANVVLRVWHSTPEQSKMPLNRVEDIGEGFIIYNYDWNSFKFAKEKGADKDITFKNSIVVPLKNLTDKEIKWLRSKCNEQ